MLRAEMWTQGRLEIQTAGPHPIKAFLRACQASLFLQDGPQAQYFLQTQIFRPDP